MIVGTTSVMNKVSPSLFLLYHWSFVFVNNPLQGSFKFLVFVTIASPVLLIDARHTRLVDWQFMFAVTIAYVVLT